MLQSISVVYAMLAQDNMQDFIQKLQTSGFKGDIKTDQDVLEFYSHDASLFEVKPELVVAPKDSEDVRLLTTLVAEQKNQSPKLSLTARSGGTCMSGGSINESIIVDFNAHMHSIGELTENSARVQPGVFYRDFEKKTLEQGAIMPSYPASRELCTVGGMVANNAGGEKSLEFGKTEKFVQELRVVLRDGNEYVVKPLGKSELDEKMGQDDLEGQIYRDVFDLVDKNYEALQQARPKVSKDSTGYHLWNVWDPKKEIFDLTQVLVGSQGTLGLVTDIKFRLVKSPAHSGTLVLFLRDLSDLGELINDVMTHKPATFEGFDNYTLMLSFKLFFYFRKTLGWLGMMKLGVQLIPDALKLFRGIPKMVLLVQFTGDSSQEVADKVHALRRSLTKYDHETLFEEDENEAKEKKFWIMRHESFNLLRKKVKDKHTAPYIDDLVVNPEHLPKFLPELRAIINKYGLLATIAGHMGDGNFHVIPLMKLENKDERAKLRPSMKEVNELVLRYGGSLSGEHNDGMSRGPWLEQMYGAKTLGLFKKTKQIFDPDNLFNPHKKTDADWDYSFSHIRDHF